MRPQLERMMNVLGLCLIVLTSVASAGFFEKHISNNDVSAGVVIEFEKEDGNTKVSVDPHSHRVDEKGYVTNAKEKLSAKMEEAKEAVGKVKDSVTHTASDKAHEMKESVKEAATDVSSKAKDKVAQVKQQVHDAKVKKQGQKGFKGFFRRVYVRMASFAGVLHLLGFAVAYGMSVWVTFASSYVLAGALPRQQFAMVQSKIYPLYFKAMASSVGMALLGYLMSHRKMFSSLKGFNLMASLVMIFVNLLYLEPRTTKVMFERMKKEKEEGREKEGLATEPAVEATTETAAGAGRSTAAATKPRIVRTREMLFRRLNSYSSLVNVVTLMSLTWHLLHLAQHLHAVC